jgi:hypothetical protein
MDGSASDLATQEHHGALEALGASPYFRGFQPRAYPLWAERHRQPVAFLEQVGIEKIGEMVQHGLSLGEVAAALDVSTRVMRKWLQRDVERLREVEEARRWAADEERAQAKAVLYNHVAFPDTARAKAIADHHQWTAERWDKELYGKSLKVDASLTTRAISYTFNLGTPETVAPKAHAVLEGSFEKIERLPEPEDVPFEVLLPSLDFSEANDA